MWEVSAETDVREYRLYRAGPGEETGRLVITVPASGWNRYEVTDAGAPCGVACRYTLTAIGKDGAESILGSRELEATTPAVLSLEQNKPNPFNPQTSIAFTVPGLERVRLEVYNAQGGLVKVLRDGPMEAGRHQTFWDGTESDGRAAPSGVYFYRLSVGKRTLARKMLLLK